MQPIEQDPRPLADGPLGRGTEIGRFVVLGLIGRGAMGEVYVAHDPELDRKIAIKLLRAEAATDAPAAAVTSRFIREAQAAAKISDPNVVVVYDVGTFAGRVFIAMELIEGHTLTYWLQLKARAMGEILRIFLAAARGLAAAHERGVIHRDFKPDNVMVTPDGHVRVVDFGLAGFGAGDAGSSAGDGGTANASGADPLTRSREVPLGLTQKGAILGTPAYMSPEQFQGARADARTDQFSFCVALYEALYHLRPFSGSTLKLLTENVVAGRVRPSVDGSLVPPSIRRTLSRGLLPDPDARFPSMRSLIEELERESTQLGVRGFAADAEAKLAGVWEAPAPDLVRGDAPLTAIKLEIQRAFLATGKAYAGASFDATCRTLDRFARRWSDIYVECCEATHVRGEQPIDVLDLRMGALNEALAHLRALSCELRRATADTVENAVRAASALGTLERCSDVKLLRAIIRPPDDPITRACVDELRDRLAGVRALAHLGHVAAGLKDAVPLEAEARRLDYKPLLAEVLFTLGTLQYHVGDLASAARVTEDAIWTAELCRHDEMAAEAAANLVFFAGHAQSRFEAGEIWSRHAENALARMGGHDLIRGWLLNNRGAMRATQGRLHEAIADQRLAIAAKEKALGPMDPDVSLSMSNAAIYLDELGDIAAAADYAERAVRIMEATLGLDHPTAAIPLTNYAELLVRLGRHGEACLPAERALAVFERETDPDSVFVAYPLSTLGLAYVALGRFEEALPPLERAARIREEKENAPARRAETHFALARALAGGRRDPERALALALAARDEYRASPPTPATERHLAEIDRWLDGAELRTPAASAQ